MATLNAGQSTTITLLAGQTLAINGNGSLLSFSSLNKTPIIFYREKTFGPFNYDVTIALSAQTDISYSAINYADGARFVSGSSDNISGIEGFGGDVKIFNSIASSYKFFIPCQQFIGSGDAKDKSSNAADLTRLASLTDAAAWANPGYVTCGAGANFGLTIPAAKFAFDLASQSVLLSFRCKKVAPVGAESIIGCGDAAAAQGFYISMRAASGGVSKVRPVLNTSGGVVSGLADSLATFGEAVATDHVITLAIDGITKGVFLYCDGALSNSYTTAFTGGTAVTAAFGVGSNTGNVGATSVAGQFSGIHFLVFNGSLPSNMGLVAQKLAAAPHLPLSDFDLEF